MDNLELFQHVVNRGLWIQAPGDIKPLGSQTTSKIFVVSDINGAAIAKATDLETAVLRAYSTVCRDLVKRAKDKT